MKGKAVAYGAVSIVNAIASYRGAGLGVDLKTEAEVELVEGMEGMEAEIVNHPKEDTLLARKVVGAVLARFGISNMGARIRTKSEIPIAKGLKSSSAASNALVLASAAAIRKILDDFEAINLGVNASLEAGVTVTGAFDDATTSYFGGLVVTENRDRRILRREMLPINLNVILYIPEGKTYTSTVDRERLRSLGELVDHVHSLAAVGEYWKAMSLNGFIYASALGMRTDIIVDALESGAVGASLTGTGPAYAAVVEKELVDEVLRSWGHLDGELRVVNTNNLKATRVV